MAGSTGTVQGGQSQGQGGTTTISTLAVQAGEQRLVVALLQAGSRLELKVVEMQPELGWLGSGFKEAAALQVLWTRNCSMN